MNTLFRCVDCNVVYEVSPFDQCPEYHYSETAGEYIAQERNDEHDTAQRHRRHCIEELAVLESPMYSEGPYFDPHRVLYFEATNGKETFLIKRWKKTVMDPFRYDIVPGRLEVKKTVDIQKVSIEKQMRHELNNPALADTKVSKFIEIVQETARHCDPEKASCNLHESSDAQIDYLPLDEEQISGILSRSRFIFNPDELQKIEHFIRNNCTDDGVMSLVLKKTPVFHPASLSEPLSN
jgi:hypothetical protein